MNNAASEWIPTSERLPDSERTVLVCLHVNGWIAVGRYIERINCWRTMAKSGSVSTKSISHWAEVQKPDKLS